MQWQELNNHETRTAFQAYWQEHIQGQALVDILGLPYYPPLSLYSELILRTDATDMNIVVDTFGARVRVGRCAIQVGHEARPYIFIHRGQYVATVDQIRSQGPAHFNLPTEEWEILNEARSSFWERITPDIIGQRLGDIILFDTTIDEGYTYCHKVIIDLERGRLTLEDLQNQMQVEVYPRSYTTGW